MSSNPAFAFVVNSLLNTNKNAKILSKAKKEDDVTHKTVEKVVELVAEDGATVDNNVTEIKSKVNGERKVKRNRFNRYELDSVNRFKPNHDDKSRERLLASIATKGVVQLFNVVRDQQKRIKHKLEKAGPSERKKAKALSEFNEEDMISKVNKNVLVKHLFFSFYD